MRNLVLILITIIVFGQGKLKVGIPDEIQVEAGAFYPLQQEGGIGTVTFLGEQLPNEVLIKGNWLVVSREAKPGKYSITILAEDTAGNSQSKVAILKILSSRQSPEPQQSSTSTSQNYTTTTTTTVTQLRRSESSSIQGSISVIDVIPNHNTTDFKNQHDKNNIRETDKQNQNRTLKVEQRKQSNESRESIVKKYSTVTSRQNVQYESSRYPAEGSDTDFLLPNNFPPSPVKPSAYQNMIGYDDVLLRAASQRHQNAIKAITNILSIINQARSNLAQAEREISHFVYHFNLMIKKQRQIQNDIIYIDTQVIEMESAVKGANKFIIQLEEKLESLEKDKENLEEQKRKLQISIGEQSKTHLILHAELTKYNSQLDQSIKQLEEAEEQCQSRENQKDYLVKQLNSLKIQSIQIRLKRKEAEYSVSEKQATVKKLRKQLLAAEEQLVNAHISLVNIQDEEKSLPGLIESVDFELKHQEQLEVQCHSLVQQLKSNVQRLERSDTEGLIYQIEYIEGNVIKLRRELMEIESKIASIVQPKKDTEVKLENTLNDIEYLEEKLYEWNKKLSQAYAEVNESNMMVFQARQSLETANARYQAETKILVQANINLQRARTEEALARLALQEMIAAYSDALPYSIVPHGNGNTNPGLPLGNNPSGSPFGPISNDGDGAPGSYKIEDWTHYLSMAFGAGVHPSFPGSVNKLFPFNLYSKVRGQSVINGANSGGNEICGGQGESRAASGRIVSINTEQNTFQCTLSTGEKVEIKVEECTTTESNIEGYKMKIGDEIIIKGVERQKGLWYALRMICFQ